MLVDESEEALDSEPVRNRDRASEGAEAEPSEYLLNSIAQHPY